MNNLCSSCLHVGERGVPADFLPRALRLPTQVSFLPASIPSVLLPAHPGAATCEVPSGLCWVPEYREQDRQPERATACPTDMQLTGPDQWDYSSHPTNGK